MLHRKELLSLIPDGVTAGSLELALRALVKASTDEYKMAARVIMWRALLDWVDGAWGARPGLPGHVEGVEGSGAGAEGLREANELLARAIEIYRQHRHPFEEAESFRYWGRVLFGAGDASISLKNLDAAMKLNLRHGDGKPKSNFKQTDRPQPQSSMSAIGCVVSAPAGGATPGQAEDLEGHDQCQSRQMAGVFRKEGEYWTVRWNKSESRLKHRKGLDYIAYLLRHPGQEFGAADLVSVIQFVGLSRSAASCGGTYQEHDSIACGLGDTGAALDATAKAQYKSRLNELREDLDLAERGNDLGRAEKARAEIEFIEAEIAAAVGLGGRDRKSSSHAERARLAVTKAIRAAISRIRDVDAEMGKHLSLSIQTGYFCAYLVAQPTSWRL